MWSGISSVATTRIGFWTWIWSTRLCGLGQEVAYWFYWKTQLVLFDQSNNTGAIDEKIDGFVLEEKSSFKMLGVVYLFQIGLGLLHFSISKPASKKIGVLIRPIKFLSPEVALYLYKSTIRPCIEYCCHVWAGVRSCYLEFLDMLQKWLCRTAGPSLAASLELLAHCLNVASLNLSYRYYFGRCLSELHELAPLPYSTRYSDKLHVISISMSTVSFLAQEGSGIFCL